MKSLSFIEAQIKGELKNILPHEVNMPDKVPVWVYERSVLIEYVLSYYRKGIEHGKIKARRKLAKDLYKSVQGSYAK